GQVHRERCQVRDIACINREIGSGVAYDGWIEQPIGCKARVFALSYVAGRRHVQSVDSPVTGDVAQVGIDVDAARARWRNQKLAWRKGPVQKADFIQVADE